MVDVPHAIDDTNGDLLCTTSTDIRMCRGATVYDSGKGVVARCLTRTTSVPARYRTGGVLPTWGISKRPKRSKVDYGLGGADSVLGW